MRILILGGGGMLGHQLFLHLRENHDVRVTLHREVEQYRAIGLFSTSNAYGAVDACVQDTLLQILGEFRPQVVINCIGIVKQLPRASQIIPSLQINALLPHQLALSARLVGARLLHFSTDCVFSGRKGHYLESDVADPEDVYGRTKLLGEVSESNCMTLRTSLIGHELDRGTSLVEWFLSQQGSVRGFRRAIFSGFPTIELARIVEMLLVCFPQAHGMWHVSSDPIDKFSLLNLIRKHYGLKTEIVPDDEFLCDRSLDSTRFREHFGYQPPSWDSMIAEMSEKRSLKP